MLAFSNNLKLILMAQNVRKQPLLEKAQLERCHLISVLVNVRQKN